MITIKASKTEENIFYTYGAVEEADIEKLKDMTEKIFPVLCEKWNCQDITFKFIDRNNKEIDTFRLWC